MTNQQKRTHDSKWKDTKEQRAARQRTRYELKKAFATSHGFSSWEKLVTEVLKGRIKLVENPPKT